jgi:lipid-A-disaccharide synthase
MPERIMIIAGESSGELYGSLLAEALQAEYPGIRITGIGGVRMKAAGVELIAGITSAFGVTEALRVYAELKKTFKKVVAELANERPQALVLIDYPDFNLKLAVKAQALGIPVFYYVSPQIWAWRKGRIKTIKKLVDMMAVALPFEEDIYKKAGVPCRFVGHPVMDEIRQELAHYDAGVDELGSAALRARVRAELGMETGGRVMAVMPGSRPHEVENLLPVIRQVIASMKERYPDFHYVLPVAPNIDEAVFQKQPLPEGCTVIRGGSIKALMAADLAVIASGTSALQAGLLMTPMVVIYRVSALTFFLAKHVVDVKYISLVNLLLEQSSAGDSGLRAVELLQEDVSSENIMAELVRICDDEAYRTDFLMQLKRVGKLFAGLEASRNVARLVGELTGAKNG